MKKDLNTLIDSFFAKKENILTENMLEQLVKAQFLKEDYGKSPTSLPSGNPFEKGKSGKGKKELTIKYSFIPEISVSELGWSSLKTVDGVSIPSAQRQQLFDYLKNIQGSNLAEKVRSINSFYKKTPEQLESEGFFKSDSKSEKIQQIISYLVFMKTLTTIITNFNAAAAGFAFESFLGVLLEGTQVPTNSGTIADLTTGGKMGKIGISLKLYSESGVEVGGSFTDLCNDMRQPKNPENPFIRYVIAIKSLKGKGMDLSGEIGIYQFDINLDNIFDVMALASTHSRECIRLPKLYISSNGQSEFSHLKKTERTEEEVKEFLLRQLSEVFSSESDRLQDWSEQLINMHETPGFWTGKDGRLGKTTPASTQLKKFIDSLISQEIVDKNRKTDFYQKLMKIYKDCESYGKGADLPSAVTTESSLKLYNILTEAVSKNKKPRKPPTPKAEKDVELADGVALATVDESISFYKSLDPDMKKKALLNTQGYIKTMQFSMTKNQLMRVVGTTGQEEAGEIAKIEVGVVNVEKVINGLATSINNQVFEIFDNLSLLTNNINSYFATGLKDDNAATTAQTAALNIDKKTEQIRTQTK